MLSTKRAARVVAMTMLVAGVLSGCSAVQPLVARINNGQIEFRVCDAIPASALEVETAPVGSTDYRTAWQVSGSAVSTLDYIFTYGTTPDGWSTAVAPARLTLEEAISVTIGDSPTAEGAVFYSVTFLGRELTEEWTDSEGQPAPEICR